jgi:hypothetical protein
LLLLGLLLQRLLLQRLLLLLLRLLLTLLLYLLLLLLLLCLFPPADNLRHPAYNLLALLLPVPWPLSLHPHHKPQEVLFEYVGHVCLYTKGPDLQLHQQVGHWVCEVQPYAGAAVHLLLKLHLACTAAAAAAAQAGPATVQQVVSASGR